MRALSNFARLSSTAQQRVTGYARLTKLSHPMVQLPVLAVLREKLIMRATFNNPSLLQHHNCVGVADGGKPVGDHEDGAPRHEGVHAALDEGLGV